MKEDKKRKKLTLGIAFRRQGVAILTPFSLSLLAGFAGFLLHTSTTLLPTIAAIANPFRRTVTTVNLLLPARLASRAFDACLAS